MGGVKRSEFTIVERRRKVEELARRGLSPSQISTVLKIPLRTIYRDLEAFRKRLAKELEGINWKAEIKKIWDRTEDAISKCYILYQETKDVEERAKIIKVLNSLITSQIKFLQAIGVLYRENVTQITNIGLTLNQQNQYIEILKNLPKEYDEVMEKWKEWREKVVEKKMSSEE